jgi:hypothetical protein
MEPILDSATISLINHPLSVLDNQTVVDCEGQDETQRTSAARVLLPRVPSTNVFFFSFSTRAAVA